MSKHTRRTYKLWEEGVTPCVVFEISSHSTWLDDLGSKRVLYESLGVNEYFVFDPLGEKMSPRLQGFRLVDGQYEPLPLADDGSLYSEELTLHLRPDGALLRLIDAATGEALPTLDEATERALDEAERAQAAEAEAARLRAELERLRQSKG